MKYNKSKIKNLFSCDELDLERHSSLKLLGVNMNEHFSWVDHVNNTIVSCSFYSRDLAKILTLCPTSSLKRQLVECLIFSRLDYNISVLDPLPACLIKRLLQVQLRAAAFVKNTYAGADCIKLEITFLITVL